MDLVGTGQLEIPVNTQVEQDQQLQCAGEL